MTADQNPGGTRPFEPDDDNQYENNRRLQAAQEEVARLARWIKFAALAFLLGFVLSVLLWWIG